MNKHGMRIYMNTGLFPPTRHKTTFPRHMLKHALMVLNAARLKSKMDDFTTSIAFASSKDTPIQRTEIIYTSIRMMSYSSSDHDSTTTTLTLTTTSTRTKTVHYTPPTLDSPAFASNVASTESTPPIASLSATSLPTQGSKNVPDGVIAGIVIGVILALTILGVLLWFYLRHRRRQWKPGMPLDSSDGSFRVLTRPEAAEPDRSSNDLTPPEPTYTSPEDSRLSAWDGASSSTPQPAVAEVRSYTRARQKPRIYDIGGPPIVEVPTENDRSRATSNEDDAIPISPTDGLPGDESIVSPVSPSPRRVHTFSWDGEGRRPGWDQWKRVST